MATTLMPACDIPEGEADPPCVTENRAAGREMTAAEMYAHADRYKAWADAMYSLASAARHRELRAQPLGERLVYAARERCPCGAGLAYDPAHEEPDRRTGASFWDCSAILLGTADKAVKHTDRLPFAFYEVKSEGQSSAHGATTRPAPQPFADAREDVSGGAD